MAVDACASNHGDLEIEEPYWVVMRLLAGAGADVNARDAEGQTAMSIASSFDDQRARKVLAELGRRNRAGLRSGRIEPAAARSQRRVLPIVRPNSAQASSR